MSTVPPSPPWPMTRTSVAALGLQRGGDAGRDRRRVAEQRVQPRELPGGLRVRRGEDLEAAGRVGGDQLAARWRASRRRARSARRAPRRSPGRRGGRTSARWRRSGSACTERCSGASSRLPTAKRADLVELAAVASVIRPAPRRRRRGRAACSRRAGRAAVLARAFSSRSHELDVEVEEASARAEPVGGGVVEHRVQRRLRDRAAAEAGDDVVDVGRQPGQRRRTFWPTIPPIADGERLLEHDDPRRRAPSAARTSSSGNGRKHLMPSAPIRTPWSRSSSTTSSIVPSTEPSATTTVSASSVR